MEQNRNGEGGSSGPQFLAMERTGGKETPFLMEEREGIPIGPHYRSPSPPHFLEEYTIIIIMSSRWKDNAAILNGPHRTLFFSLHQTSNMD